MPRCDVNGTSLYFEVAGHGHSTFFIHGMCGNANVWDGQVGLLSPQLRCVTYDRRGHTRSPLGVIATRTVELHADDASALIESLGIAPCVLVASSGGARIGVDLLRRYSELFTTAILSEPPIFRLDPEDGGRQIMKDLQPPLEAAFRRGEPGAAVDAFFEYMCPGLWKRLTDAQKEPYRANSAELLGDLQMPPYEIARETLSGIDIPCAIVSGTTSHPVLRRVARVIADAMPHATLVEIEGIGHVTYAEAPDEFARIVRQWSGVPVPGAYGTCATAPMANTGLMRTNVNGHAIAYRCAGQGPPLVLLHGFTLDSRIWRRQLEDLSDQFMVVAWDAPGAGASSDPPNPFTMADWAHCLAGFLDVLDIDRAHILGMSWGGVLAQEFYRLHSTRTGSLVLAGTYAGWRGSLPPVTCSERLATCMRAASRPAEEFVPQWIPGLISAAASQDVRDELSLVVSDFHPVGFRLMAQSLHDTDTTDLLPQIRVPTLLLWGDADQRSPLSIAEQLRDRIPASELIVIPNAGHVGNMEQPDVFNAQVRRFCSAHA